MKTEPVEPPLVVSPQLYPEDPVDLARDYPGIDSAPHWCVALDLGNGDYDASYHSAPTVHVPTGIARSWDCPRLTAPEANRFLEETAGIAQRILDGASIVCSGDRWVSRLDAAATAAEAELAAALLALAP